MPNYRVHVPDHHSRRLMTSAQWLAECRVRDKNEPRTRVFDLPSPVHIQITAEDDRTRTVRTCRTSTQLFALLGKGLVTACSWAGAKLGAHGLYSLNRAIHTAAVRSGGRSIVRHWLETRTGPLQPLGGDFANLLSFLEIRPVPCPLAAKKAPHAGHYVAYI